MKRNTAIQEALLKLLLLTPEQLEVFKADKPPIMFIAESTPVLSDEINNLFPQDHWIYKETLTNVRDYWYQYVNNKPMTFLSVMVCFSKKVDVVTMLDAYLSQCEEKDAGKVLADRYEPLQFLVSFLQGLAITGE